MKSWSQSIEPRRTVLSVRSLLRPFWLPLAETPPDPPEGTAWEEGGSVAWQMFDAAGHPVGAEAHADGLPVWGLVAAFANPHGGFTFIY